ncbi:hypothetical protein SERN_2975 [Serinibacter arcticus]|uniref:Uncharacterized protein n=1 Tax=Serinibacter arcticus TaxID=1655435 RepID=A0A4Z1DW12_9MICO|nr:hypothetical protein SERN_2975 [Serinibacter arcticus]
MEQLDAVAVPLEEIDDVDPGVRGPGHVQLERHELGVRVAHQDLPGRQRLVGVVTGRVDRGELPSVVVTEELPGPVRHRLLAETVHRRGGRERVLERRDAGGREAARTHVPLPERLDVREGVGERRLLRVVVRGRHVQVVGVGQVAEVLGREPAQRAAERLDVLEPDRGQTVHDRHETVLVDPVAQGEHLDRDLLGRDLDELLGLGVDRREGGDARAVHGPRVQLEAGRTGHDERAGAGGEGDRLTADTGEGDVGPAGGGGDRGRRERSGVGRTPSQLDRARALGASGDAVDVDEVHRVVGELAALTEDDLLEGLRAVVGHALRAREGVGVLGLLLARVDDRGDLARRGGGGGGTGVRVLGDDDAVQLLGLTVLHGVRRGGEAALAGARDALQRVRVAVVTQTEGPVQPVAGDDGAVLRVGGGELVGQDVAPREEPTVGRVVPGQDGRLVADRDDDARDTALALGVRDPKAHGVPAGRGERVLRGGGGGVGLAVAVEVPRVGQCAALGVGRAGPVERDGRRSGGRGVRGRRRERDGSLVARRVLDAVQARLGVLAEEALAVVEHVHRPVGADLHVDRAGPAGLVGRLERLVGHEVLELLDLAVPVRAGLGAEALHADGRDVVLGVLVQEGLAVPVLRELTRVGDGLVVLEDRTTHRALAAARGEVHELGEGLVGGVVAVVQLRRGGRRERVETGVPARVVDRSGLAVEEVTARRRREVPVVVVRVRTVAVRPTAVERLGRRLPLHVAHRATLDAGDAGVRPVVAPRHGARLGVDGHAEGVAQTGREDLGSRVRGALGPEVALGDRVGTVLGHRDAQDRSAQVVGVAGAAAGVEARVHARGVVVGGEAVGSGGARRGVVTGRDEDVAVQVEVDVAADVAALAALDADLEDDLLGGHVEGARLEVPLHAGELVVALPLVPVGGLVLARGQDGGRGALRRGGREALLVHHGGGVVQVHPAVVLEVGVERKVLQPVLRVRVDGNLGDHVHDAGVRVGVADASVAGGGQDRQVGQDLQADRLTDVLGQRDTVVVGPVQGLGVGRGGSGVMVVPRVRQGSRLRQQQRRHRDSEHSGSQSHSLHSALPSSSNDVRDAEVGIPGRRAAPPRWAGRDPDRGGRSGSRWVRRSSGGAIADRA